MKGEQPAEPYVVNALSVRRNVRRITTRTHHERDSGNNTMIKCMHARGTTVRGFRELCLWDFRHNKSAIPFLAPLGEMVKRLTLGDGQAISMQSAYPTGSFAAKGIVTLYGGLCIFNRWFTRVIPGSRNNCVAETHSDYILYLGRIRNPRFPGMAGSELPDAIAISKADVTETKDRDALEAFRNQKIPVAPLMVGKEHEYADIRHLFDIPCNRLNANPLALHLVYVALDGSTPNRRDVVRSSMILLAREGSSEHTKDRALLHRFAPYSDEATLAVGRKSEEGTVPISVYSAPASRMVAELKLQREDPIGSGDRLPFIEDASLVAVFAKPNESWFVINRDLPESYNWPSDSPCRVYLCLPTHHPLHVIPA